MGLLRARWHCCWYRRLMDDGEGGRVFVEYCMYTLLGVKKV